VSISEWSTNVAAATRRNLSGKSGELASLVAESASLAATAPPLEGAAEIVQTAARHGANALARGIAPPLPLLLDIEVLLRSRSSGRAQLRPLNAPTIESASYDQWLRQFVARAMQYLRIPRYNTKNADKSFDLTFLLAEQFALPEPNPELWSAFDNLADASGIHNALRIWAAPRSIKRWSSWYPQRLEDFTPHNWEQGVWAQFATARGSAWLDERCDHEAARTYFEAANVDPQTDQQRRISNLVRRRPLQEPNPLTQSYEEQALYYGAITAATLASGEYGEFKIANRTDIRLNEPPPIRPPRDFGIHLCWAHAYQAIMRTLPAPVFSNAEQEPRGLLREASLLQALTALLFDDWRSALRMVNVSFYAHRGSPDHATDSFGPPGRRWKPSKIGEPMPPPEAIGRFFHRANWCSVDKCGLTWKADRAIDDWWCLILLKSELGDFRLREHQDDRLRVQGVLAAPTDALPAAISTLIVLDPATYDGAIYRVTPDTDERSLRVYKIRVRRSSRSGDPSFQSLRMQALDALLDTLDGIR
jgi:hypothetical protein